VLLASLILGANLPTPCPENVVGGALLLGMAPVRDTHEIADFLIFMNLYLA
jgi:hypothetical protein